MCYSPTQHRDCCTWRKRREGICCGVSVHSIGNMCLEGNSPSTEAGPHKVVAGQHACCILWIGVGKVIQHRVEQQESTNGEPSGTDDWHNPVYTWSSTPTEPEEADGDAETTDHSWNQPFLRLDVAVVVELRLQIVIEVREEGRYHQKCANN